MPTSALYSRAGDGSHGRDLRRAGPWLAAALGLALYLPSLGGGWTLDDDAALRGHPVVRGDAPLVEAFTREFWGRPLSEGWSSSYRPLVTLSFAVEQRLWPGPMLPRAVGLLCYALLCGVVVVLARRWLGPASSLGAGALFALMPAHADNAASIIGRADTLGALFGVSALLMLLRATDVIAAAAGPIAAGPAATSPGATEAVVRPLRGAPWRGALWPSAAAGGLYLLALLCKESMALLPALAAWLCALHLHRTASPRHVWLALGVCLWPIAATGACYLLWRQTQLPVGLPPDFVAADNLLAALAPAPALLLRLRLVADYLDWSLVGASLCVDHTYADRVAVDILALPDALCLAVGVAAIAVAGVDGHLALRRRGPGLLVAAALAYVVVGQWVVPLSVVAAERLALWPSLWLALALCGALGALYRASDGGSAGRRRVLVVAAGVWAVSLASVAAGRGLEWRDRLALHQASAIRCPAAVHNRLNLSQEYARTGDLGRALWHLGVATAGQRAFPRPLELPAFAMEAEARAALGDDAAIPALERLPLAVGAAPAGYWRQLAAVAERVRQPQTAAAARSLSVSTDPDAVDPAAVRPGRAP